MRAFASSGRLRTARAVLQAASLSPCQGIAGRAARVSARFTRGRTGPAAARVGSSGSDNIPYAGASGCDGLWAHCRQPRPRQLLVCLDVQPGAATVPGCVSLPTGFVRAFTLGPPSSSPSLHHRGSCGHTSGVTGVPFGSNVPLPSKSPLPFSCLQPMGSGRQKS